MITSLVKCGVPARYDQRLWSSDKSFGILRTIIPPKCVWLRETAGGAGVSLACRGLEVPGQGAGSAGRTSGGVLPCSQGRAQGKGLHGDPLLYQAATSATYSLVLWRSCVSQCEQRPNPAGGQGNSSVCFSHLSSGPGYNSACRSSVLIPTFITARKGAPYLCPDSLRTPGTPEQASALRATSA